LLPATLLEELYLDNVVPFRAWRYSPQAGELADLVAPPYDVVGPELQSALYARSPNNVVRVDLGVAESGDTDSQNKYSRAAGLLESWKTSGALTRDDEPTLTFVEEVFTGPDGLAGRRYGVLAAMRLTEFDEGVVFPHEHTLTGPKEDRFRLMTTTAMSLSPVFLLYDLPGDDITSAWKKAAGAEPPTSTTTDDTGNVTRLWRCSDPYLLGMVRERLAHRYETALRYQKTQAAAATRPSASPAASDYCLVYLANKSDPALTIYPTHRLVAGLPERLILDLPRSLADTFDVERLAEGDIDSNHAARAVAAQKAIVRRLPGVGRRYPTSPGVGQGLGHLGFGHGSREPCDLLQRHGRRFREIGSRGVPGRILHEPHRTGSGVRGRAWRRADATEDDFLLSQAAHRAGVSRPYRTAVARAAGLLRLGVGSHFERLYPQSVTVVAYVYRDPL
jgi:uncharacterized protein (DUF1015 family)